MVPYKFLKLCGVFVQIVPKTLDNYPKVTVLNERSRIIRCNCMGAQAQPIYTRSLMEKMAASVTMEYRRSILRLVASSKCLETADRGQR